MGRVFGVEPDEQRHPCNTTKIVIHVLIHEIRHWPQIATLLRVNGIVADVRDFIFSPVVPRQSG